MLSFSQLKTYLDDYCDLYKNLISLEKETYYQSDYDKELEKLPNDSVAYREMEELFNYYSILQKHQTKISQYKSKMIELENKIQPYLLCLSGKKLNYSCALEPGHKPKRNFELYIEDNEVKSTLYNLQS